MVLHRVAEIKINYACKELCITAHGEGSEILSVVITLINITINGFNHITHFFKNLRMNHYNM